jgi:hypothetical protein
MFGREVAIALRPELAVVQSISRAHLIDQFTLVFRRLQSASNNIL